MRPTNGNLGPTGGGGRLLGLAGPRRSHALARRYTSFGISIFAQRRNSVMHRFHSCESPCEHRAPLFRPRRRRSSSGAHASVDRSIASSTRRYSSPPRSSLLAPLNEAKSVAIGCLKLRIITASQVVDWRMDWTCITKRRCGGACRQKKTPIERQRSGDGRGDGLTMARQGEASSNFVRSIGYTFSMKIIMMLARNFSEKGRVNE